MNVTQGAEPLIIAAAGPAAGQGAHYGPTRFAGLAGPMKRVRLPRGACRQRGRERSSSQR
jgi:hypothetical protein